MSILVFERHTPRRLEEMYFYMVDPLKTSPQGLFGIGVTVENAVAQMKFVQNIYKFESLLHEYIQIIFCFDVGIKASLTLIREICERIGQVLITDERQVFGAIHYLDNPDKIHCHYMINFIGIDGSLYQQNYSVKHYKLLVNEILADYNLNLIKSR